MVPLILAYPQAGELLQGREAGVTEVETSPDLGLTRMVASCSGAGAAFPLPDGHVELSWTEIEEIAANDVNCYACRDSGIEKIVRFSEESNRVYTLMPTLAAPTMLISGIPMHRIKETDPVRDTREKVKALRSRGRVLDTATGLGYTAIETARHAEQVITIEVEPTVLELCRLNPWSQPLFARDNITQLLGDSYELIHDFADREFDGILHDPPAFGIDGELYSATVYREFMRILKPKGRLFHYIGNPKSKSGGNVTRGVIRRLDEAGFVRVTPRHQAFGVVAQRP